MKIVRGSRQRVVVQTNYDHLQVISAAKSRFFQLDQRFNADLHYDLYYQDGSSAETLPRNRLPFTVKSYKELLKKDYIKIVLYLCPKGKSFINCKCSCV